MFFMADVVAKGELLIDFACTDINSIGYPVLSANPGGAPANYLAALAGFGVSAAFIGKVGSDSFGRHLVDTIRLAGIILNDYAASIVFVTLGKDGCYYSNGRDCGYVSVLQGIKAVDTTGAGDIFGGSAMYGILKTGKALNDISADELRGIAGFAVTASGLSVMKQGGIPSIPSLEEVLKY